MDDLDLFIERFTLLILIGLTNACYRIAEWFGRLGINCEVRYRQLATP